MKLSLLDVLQLPELKDFEFLNTEAELTRSVSGISIYIHNKYWGKSGDILVIDWEMLLREKIECERFISKIETRGINALFIKANRNMKQIKQEIKSNVNNLILPVILLSKEVHIAEVMNKVTNKLNTTELYNIRHYKSLHDKFTSLAIDGEGLETMIKYLKEEIGNPVVVYDQEFNTLISTDSELGDSAVDQYVHSKEQNLNILLYNRQMVNLPNLDRKVQRIIFPIRLNKKIRAYLAVFELNKTLVEQDYISLEVAATTAILEMKRRLSMAEVEKKFHNDLIYDVISGKIELEEVIYERASLMGLNLRKVFSVVVIKAEDTALSKNEDIHFQFSEKIHKNFENHLKYYWSNQIIGSIGTSIILLLPVGENAYPEFTKKFKEVFKIIQEKIQNEKGSISLTAGIGRIATRLREIKTSYLEALDTVTYGSLLYGDNTCKEFNEIGIFKILCKFENREELAEFIPESLNNLVEYDKTNNSNLVKTLEVFLKCNSNASKAAKRLYIHYKTMQYRLERIHEISCIELGDYEAKLQIQIGLKILYLLERKKER